MRCSGPGQPRLPSRRSSTTVRPSRAASNRAFRPYGKSKAQSKELFALWTSGDAAGAEQLVAQLHRDAEAKPFERFFVDTLLDARNKSMADKAESTMERHGTTFFAVGTLHLFGQRGLLREFEARGYRVRDLQ